MTSTTSVSQHSVSLPLATARPVGSRRPWSFLIDIAVMLFLFAAVFGMYAIGRSWLGPVAPGAGPLVVIYVDDLAATEKQIRDAGGKITKNAFSFPGGSRFHFADPDGNELAAWTEG